MRNISWVRLTLAVLWVVLLAPVLVSGLASLTAHFTDGATGVISGFLLLAGFIASLHHLGDWIEKAP